MTTDTTHAAIEAKEHMSDCSVHNGPAFPEGPCDCGAGPQISNRKALRKAQLRIGRQRDELAFLKAELDTARAERDDYYERWNDCQDKRITAAAERDAALRERDAGAKDYCALMERHDAEFVRAEKAETEAAALRGEVARLRDAMQPFDRMAGAMFARNWNRDGVAISFVENDGPIRLTFADFLAVRAALLPEPLGHGVTADDFGGEA